MTGDSVSEALNMDADKVFRWFEYDSIEKSIQESNIKDAQPK